MGILDKILGNANESTTSSQNVEQFYIEGETTIKIYRYVRDEIVISNKGFYVINVQGMGKKIEYKFFPNKSLTYISIETAGRLDLDFEVKIGMKGNTEVKDGKYEPSPVIIKVSRKEQEMGLEMYKIVKTVIYEEGLK